MSLKPGEQKLLSCPDVLFDHQLWYVVYSPKAVHNRKNDVSLSSIYLGPAPLCAPALISGFGLRRAQSYYSEHQIVCRACRQARGLGGFSEVSEERLETKKTP